MPHKMTLVIVDPKLPHVIDAFYHADINLIAVLTGFKYCEALQKRFLLDRDKFSEVIEYDSDFKKLCDRLAHHDIDEITAGREHAVPLAIELGLALNKPTCGPHELIKTLSSKFHMVDILRQRGVPAGKSLRLTQSQFAETLNRVPERLQFPVIVKPALSEGSFGFEKAYDQAQLKAKCEKLFSASDHYYGTPVTELVIEEMHVGTEYGIYTMSHRGQHAIAEVYEYEDIDIDGNLFTRCLQIMDPQAPQAQHVADYTQQVLDAMHFENGLAANEVYLTADGPRLIEVNPRAAGLHGLVNRLSEYCSGQSQVSIATATYCQHPGWRVPYYKNYQLIKQGCILFLRNYFAGHIKTLAKLNAILNLPSVLESVISEKKVGEWQAKSVDIFSSSGILLLAHESLEQLQQDRAAIEEIEQQGLFS